jgi:hypothetical protein
MNDVSGEKTNQAILSKLRGFMSEWMSEVGDTHTRPKSV